MNRLIGLVQQFFRFGIIGILSVGVDMGLLIILTDLVGWDYIVTAALTYSVSVIFNYVLSMRFVFEGREEQNKMLQLSIFVFLSVIGLLFTQLIMCIAVESLGIDYKLAKLVSAMIVAVYNFVSRKVFLEEKDWNRI